MTSGKPDNFLIKYVFVYSCRYVCVTTTPNLCQIQYVMIFPVKPQGWSKQSKVKRLSKQWKSKVVPLFSPRILYNSSESIYKENIYNLGNKTSPTYDATSGCLICTTAFSKESISAIPWTRYLRIGAQAVLNRLQEIGVRSLRPKATVLTAFFIWYKVSSTSMLQTRNVTSFLLGQVGVVHRRSK